MNELLSTENLLGLRADADGTQEPVNDPKAAMERPKLDPATLKKLGDLGKTFCIHLLYLNVLILSAPVLRFHLLCSDIPG